MLVLVTALGVLHACRQPSGQNAGAPPTPDAELPDLSVPLEPDAGAVLDAPWPEVGAPADAPVDAGQPPPADAASDLDATSGAEAGVPPEPPPLHGAAVLTYRNDNLRTGAYLAERQLDVAKVRSRGLVRKFSNQTEGEVNAQVLYVPALPVMGKMRDVAFVVTYDNNVYAFDTNEASPRGATEALTLWQASFPDPENPTSRPYPRGIYSTPVIDLSTYTMYLVFSTRNTREDTGKQLTPQQVAALDVEFFLAAIDIRDGRQLRVKKVAGSYPTSAGGRVAFEARHHWCRPALLFGHGSLYFACGMRPFEDDTVYHGWVFRYDAATFAPQGTFCTTPDRSEPGQNAGIWQSGSGLAEDPDGNVYLISGNGPADFAHRSYGDALIKLTPSGDHLDLAGAFTPDDPEGNLSHYDVDFGSGGALLLPDLPYVLGAGKTGIAYLLERASMKEVQHLSVAVNQYDPTAPVDLAWSGGPHIHGTLTYWRAPGADTAYLYNWGEQDYLRRQTLDLVTRRLDPARSKKGAVVGRRDLMPGGMLSLSANGRQLGTGVLWATLSGDQGDARLFAFDAETLDLLWQTVVFNVPKWMPPTIADGKLLIGTPSNHFLVYELGPAPPP